MSRAERPTRLRLGSLFDERLKNRVSVKFDVPLRWVIPNPNYRPKPSVSSSTPLQGELRKPIPSGATPVAGCRVKLEVNEKGSFSLVEEPGSACAQELAKTTKLGPENRKYLLSKFKANDPKTQAELDALKKRETNRK